MKYAATALAAPILLCAALGVPVPHLIGYGCTNAPTVAGVTYTGPRLAVNEDDFQRCDDIHPIF